MDSSQLPLVEGPDGDQVFRFYWLDAFEEPYIHPGSPRPLRPGRRRRPVSDACAWPRCGVPVREGVDRVGQVPRQLLRYGQEHREDRVPPAPGAGEFSPPRPSSPARPSPSLGFPGQRVDPKTGEASEAPVAMMDVYQEFNELSEKFKIMKYKSKVGVGARGGGALGDGALTAACSISCFQRVEKNYAFEIPDVPSRCEYLEVRYSVSGQGAAPCAVAR